MRQNSNRRLPATLMAMIAPMMLCALEAPAQEELLPAVFGDPLRLPNPVNRTIQLGDAAVGDLDNDGDLDIISVGTGTSNLGDQVWLNDGSGNFTEKVQPDIRPIYQSERVFLNDLDGDSDLDAFVANRNQQRDLKNQVWVNQGGEQSGELAHFLLRQEVAGDSLVSGVAMGDIDGDGDADFLTNTTPVRTVKVWSNDGSGAFGSEPTAEIPGYLFPGEPLGDIDKDGDPDLIVALDGQLRAYSNSAGAFSEQGVLPGSEWISPFAPERVIVADLNRDGASDVLIFQNPPDPGSLLIAWNTGNGAFDEPVPLDPDYSNAVNADIGDLNGDGLPDLVLARSGATPEQYQDHVWVNRGNRSFVRTQDALGLSQDPVIRVGDFDDDGALDACDGRNIFLNKIGGQPVAKPRPDPEPREFAFGGSPLPLSDAESVRRTLVTDMDGDTLPDIVRQVTGGVEDRIEVWTNPGGESQAADRAFSLSITLELSPLEDQQLEQAADIDLDGHKEILVASTKGFRWWKNDGGRFVSQFAFLEGRYSCPPSDIDLDGDPDLATADNENIYLFENSDGAFDSPLVIPHQDPTQPVASLEFTDLEGDGDPDLLATYFRNGPFRATYIYTNSGGNQLGTAGEFSLTNEVLTNGFVATGDSNGDLIIDVLVRDFDFRRRHFLGALDEQLQSVNRLDSSGVYLHAAEWNTEFSEYISGDFDLDGSDSYLAGNSRGTIEVINAVDSDNQGHYRLHLAQSLITGNRPIRDLILADLDADCFPELIVGSENQLWSNVPAGSGLIISFACTDAENENVGSEFGSPNEDFGRYMTSRSGIDLALNRASEVTMSIDYTYFDTNLDEAILEAGTAGVKFESGSACERITVGETEGEIQNKSPADCKFRWFQATLASPVGTVLAGPRTFWILFRGDNPLDKDECSFRCAGPLVANVPESSSSRQPRDNHEEPDLLTTLRQFRDTTLQATPQGRHYTRLYYEHTGELTQLLFDDIELLGTFARSVGRWAPAIRAVVIGEDSEPLTQEMLEDAKQVFRLCKASGSPEFRTVIEVEEAALNLDSFVGLTMDEAIAKMNTRPLSPDFERIDLSKSAADSAELRWQSTPGHVYRVQRSENLETFVPSGDPVAGDGSVLKTLIDTTGKAAEFFRVVIESFVGDE